MIEASENIESNLLCDLPRTLKFSKRPSPLPRLYSDSHHRSLFASAASDRITRFSAIPSAFADNQEDCQVGSHLRIPDVMAGRERHLVKGDGSEARGLANPLRLLMKSVPIRSRSPMPIPAKSKQHEDGYLG